MASAVQHIFLVCRVGWLGRHNSTHNYQETRFQKYEGIYLKSQGELVAEPRQNFEVIILELEPGNLKFKLINKLSTTLYGFNVN